MSCVLTCFRNISIQPSNTLLPLQNRTQVRPVWFKCFVKIDDYSGISHRISKAFRTPFSASSYSGNAALFHITTCQSSDIFLLHRWSTAFESNNSDHKIIAGPYWSVNQAWSRGTRVLYIWGTVVVNLQQSVQSGVTSRPAQRRWLTSRWITAEVLHRTRVLHSLLQPGPHL